MKSLLCIPILNQGKHIGILYMENNSAAGTFTPIRLQILSILSAQAAISIENARLYNEMELKVKERTLELEKTNRELHSMNEELTRMETSRRHLLTNISHDLRTPMTLIQGYVEGILEGVIDDPEKQKKYLTMIYTKIIALNHLITDLFHLTTLEARKVSLAIQPITIKNLIQHVSNRFELDMLNAGLQFEAQLICMLPNDEIYCVGIDLNRIDQVFYNLIFNSMRYTSEGGAIRISFEVTQSVAEEAEACTGLNSAGDELQITVKDTGVGISEEDISFIFDRFYKGNKSRNMQEEGSGLGLAISKEIIESHGGRIWVESKRNEGSAFSFTLPLQGIV